MSVPYPEPVRTTKRCQYAMPGTWYYNCRRMGKYLLEDKGFCAPHFSWVWQVLHPVFGTQHDWEQRPFMSYETCAQCGTVKQHAGIPQDPCRGKVNKIVLWEN